jgi:pyruvate kinase
VEDFEREDVRFILQNDIDFVIHSIYNNHHEILDFRSIIKEEAEALGPLAINKDVRIMAKLENEDAINDLNKILEVSDAIMVPRGQLGTVLPIEKISWIQKNIIKLCNY